MLIRSLGDDLLRIRTEAAASQATVSNEAGIDRSHMTRIEAGTARPSLETLVAIATALGADVSIRLYTGRGPRLIDRHSARMIETLLRELAPTWQPHLEVGVFRPVRGFIDAVLERRDTNLLVIGEFESTLPRLEQQLRWAAEKAAAIGSSDLVGPDRTPRVSRLLVLRSIESTRSIAKDVRGDTPNGVPRLDKGCRRFAPNRLFMAWRRHRLGADRRRSRGAPRWPASRRSRRAEVTDSQHGDAKAMQSSR